MPRERSVQDFIDQVKNPKALAAYIGRKKYGKKRFQQLAAKGKR